MQRPDLNNWHFVRMTTGLPVEEHVVEGLLTTIDEKGIVLMHEMGIGIQGDAKSYFGEYDRQIDGTRSKIVRIRKDRITGRILLLTADYNEYVVSRDMMLHENEALAEIIDRTGDFELAELMRQREPKNARSLFEDAMEELDKARTGKKVAFAVTMKNGEPTVHDRMHAISWNI